MPKATLVYIFDKMTEYVLLAKKRRKIGIGKWFGYGGGFKLIDHNDPIACIIREVKEETNGVIVIDRAKLELIGTMKFYNGFWKIPGIAKPFVVICYRAIHDITVLPGTTEEMEMPTLFNIRKLPWHEFKNGDRKFVPYIFCRIPFTGWQWFSKSEKKVYWSSIIPRDKEYVERIVKAL